MAGKLRVPRSRGAISGVLLVLLGLWGGLIPLVGPYFNYAYTPDRSWALNSGRFWLSIMPGIVTVLGGLIVLLSANRATAVAGAWLAAVAGAWFVVGAPVSTLWTSDGGSAAGEPVGGTVARAFEQLGFFTGLGTVIVFFAAMALGRFTVVGVKEMAMAERDAAAADALRERDQTEHVPTTADADEDPPPLTTAPGTTTAPAAPATYTGGTVGDERPESERAARRLDDDPDERLRSEKEAGEHRPRQTT